MKKAVYDTCHPDHPGRSEVQKENTVTTPWTGTRKGTRVAYISESQCDCVGILMELNEKTGYATLQIDIVAAGCLDELSVVQNVPYSNEWMVPNTWKLDEQIPQHPVTYS